MLIGGASAITTGANTNGNIDFDSTVNGAQALTLTAGTGNIAFDRAVGATNRLGLVTINEAGNVTISDSKAGGVVFNVTAFDQATAGTGTFTLGAAEQLNASTGAVTINSMESISTRAFLLLVLLKLSLSPAGLAELTLRLVTPLPPLL